MSETTLTYIVIVSILYGVIQAIRAARWRAKYEELNKHTDAMDGWREEARFWRRHFNKDAAEAVEEL